MKIAALVLLAIVALPFAAYADSSQPNSAPGIEGRPVTSHGEGTTGTQRRVAPGTTGSGSMMRSGAGTTDAGKTGHGGTAGASDSSIPGATNPNEPMGRRK
jgi:hypothetical protein